jgi:EmrB/QacA subfamily drug resistance transporter
MESIVAKKKGFEKHEWLILITLMIASFLGRLDGTIVNLALPKIIQSFKITVSQASWISTAYIIANAIFVPVFGKLGDLIGRKKLYIFGIAGFTLTSVLTGFSFNLPSMVIFRILQAITVSIDYPIALSIIAKTFEDKGRRAMAMGLWSAIFAVAQVFGPLIGGPLIDNFSWRSVFFINLPLGLIGCLMAIRYIQEPVVKVKGLKNFDILGSVLLGTCLGILVLLLDQGQSWGWFNFKSVFSAILILTTGFFFLRTEKHALEPVVDLKFFKNRTFTAAIITSFITFLGMIGGMFLLPLFIQNYLQYSVTKTGLLFIPMAVGMMLSAQTGARLSSKIQPRFLVCFSMLFTALMMYSFSFIDIRWTGFDVAWRLFFLASGLGLGMSPLTNAATSTVPVHEVGVASSVLALARNISGAFGIAIFATILSNSITSHMVDLQQYSIVNSQNPQVIAQVFSLMAIKANLLAFSTVFRTTIIFMIIGAISALFIKENKKDFVIKPQESIEF